MASTRKRSDGSVLSLLLLLLDSVKDSTRDAAELMIPVSNFMRTGSPIFNRNVVNASDTRECPLAILHMAVIN
jgi:hypothetical protein